MRTPFLASAVLALLFAACSSDAVNPGGGGGGDATGGIKVLLTDSPFPFDLVARADVYIVRVDAGVDSGSIGADCRNATTIVEPRKRFDLLTLQRGITSQMGKGSLPDGDYGAVCVTINTDSSSLTLKDGTVLRHDTDPGINWSGSGERIIKADILSPIPVVDTQATFVIHFDVGKSFIPATDVEPPGPAGWFDYIPAIEAIDPDMVGSITGTVASGSGTPAPVANASIRAMVGNPAMDPGTWFVSATGTSDSLGHFKLAFLLPSSHWTGASWVYIVEVYPPSTSALEVQRIPGVTVTAGAETALGTITLN